MSKYERDDQLTIRITAAIEATIKELIPVQQILKTYMSNDTSNIDVGGEPEDAEVEDEEEPAPEVEEPSAEGEVGSGGEGEAGAEPAPATPQETEELKSISVPAPPPDVSENLFDDAIDEEKKP